MKINSSKSSNISGFKGKMKVANSGEPKDSFTASVSSCGFGGYKPEDLGNSLSTCGISASSAKPEKVKYKPDYDYGKVVNVGDYRSMDIEWAETMSINDALAMGDQLGIELYGFKGARARGDEPSNKKFTGLSKYKYQHGTLLSSCGYTVTVGWGTTMSRNKAERIAKEHGTRLRFAPYY